MSWDDDGFEPVLPPGVEVARFDDEVDKTLVEEPEEAAPAGPAAPGVFKPKHAAKEKKKAEEAEAALSKTEEGPSDPAARRVWLEERQKAADLALAMDSFGIAPPPAAAAAGAGASPAAGNRPAGGAAASRGASTAASASAAAPAGSLAAATAGVALSDPDSYRVAGARVGQCVADAVGASKAGGPGAALAFAKEVLAALTDRLSADDFAALRVHVDSLRNKKLQSAKVAPVKKPAAAAGKKGAKLRIEADDDYLSHGVGASADDYADMGESSGAGAVSAGGAAPRKTWEVADDFM